MAKYIQIEIPKPCHEKWEDMQATAVGSFCDSCQKTVTDFTGMTDNQLMEYFKKNPAAVCGRFYTDQLEKQFEIPPKRIPWLKYFFRITLPALLFSYKANAQRLIKKYREPVVMTGKKLPQPVFLAPAVTISGKITSKNGGAVPFASVMIKGTNHGVAADSNGEFTLQLTGTERFLEITAAGYEKQLVAITTTHTDVQLNIPLNENIVMDAVIIRASTSVSTGAVIIHISTSSIWNKKKTGATKTIEATSSIKLFPNPLKRNGQLSISFDKPLDNNQQIMIYNLSGIKLMQKTININQPLRDVQLKLDLNAGGYYIVEVIDAKTNEKQVARVVVE